MKCSECDCVMDLFKEIDFKHCMRCTKQKCCCITIHKLNKQNSPLIFFYNTRTLFAAALGIEILYISAAVDLIFYKQSMLLSIPLALLAGTLAVVLPEAYKKAKMSSGLN
jgi:hypothetical protein